MVSRLLRSNRAAWVLAFHGSLLDGIAIRFMRYAIPMSLASLVASVGIGTDGQIAPTLPSLRIVTRGLPIEANRVCLQQMRVRPIFTDES